MGRFTNALSFLESVAGYSQNIVKGAQGSAAEPVRLAVIDPFYDASSYPIVLPRVTFEGEDTMSDKTYPVVGTYLPQPNHRVVLLPVGHTYVIVGTINTPREILVESRDAAAQVSTTNTAFVSLSGGPVAAINLRKNQRARIVVSCNIAVSATGTNGAVMSFRTTGPLGTTAAVEMDGSETGSTDWVPLSRTTIIPPVGASGNYQFESQYKAIGTVTALFKNRRISAEGL